MEQSLAHVPLLLSGDLDDSSPAVVAQDIGQSTATSSPFFLSEAYGPVPDKPVKKIQALEFVDMADLLPDNLEQQRLEEKNTSKEDGYARRRTRDVAQLLTRVQCFTTYVAIVGETSGKI